jgi:hypothetical protein
MTTVLDVWRAVDPEARLVSGAVERTARPVRGVARTRAAPPHFPTTADGQLLVADAAAIPAGGIDGLLAGLREAELDPAAVWLAGDGLPALEAATDPLPVLVGGGMGAARADSAAGYLDGEREWLASVTAELRLAGAEAALADPQPSAPAGVAAARLHRGVAVSVDGALASLNPRPAGRALATRFAAAHARLLGERAAPGRAARRTRDGLWTLERSIGPSAAAWLFDDLPFAAVDEVALDALAVTLRALLRRRPAERALGRQGREARVPPSTGDPLRDTLLAVARANGRIAPAARSLGVHRNTVLYRLHRASVELGIDPRRPDDALRLLREAEAGRD